MSFAETNLCCVRCAVRCCNNCSHNAVVTVPSVQLFPEFPLQLYFSVILHNSKTQHLLQTAVLFQALQFFWDRNYEECTTQSSVIALYWKVNTNENIFLPKKWLSLTKMLAIRAPRKKKKTRVFLLHCRNFGACIC